MKISEFKGNSEIMHCGSS